ncbi:response regulator (plasmid) [Burkholderia thailandensis]|uniref:hybrid sensor histidine kinase/response regulator n=1 Tax=Burkholderia thailandensis TaxID=57975 RepID=UPI00192DAB2D|nr:hybrid sensor histidine kinase/response regulator [Burkholderia thailandensis]MBS2132352.1 response regulator [Burkholderia thailandensis]QRA15157.1 response regulator [Burkholderia thailandensis]
MNIINTVRRVNVSIAIVVLLATGALFAWGYRVHDLLSSSRSLDAIIGPRNDPYWLLAQFQLATTDVQHELWRFEHGHGDGARGVTDRIVELRRRYDSVAHPSEAAEMLTSLPLFGKVIAHLDGELTGIESLGSTLAQHPENAEQLIVELKHLREGARALTEDVGRAETARREQVYRDFVHSRDSLFLASLGVAALALVLGALVLRNMQRSRRLMVQQSAAAFAEHRASVAAADTVQAKNAFLGAVGHELRTPLQSITLAIETLTDPEEDDEDVRARAIERLQRAGSQLEAQMKDLTDYVRLDSGKLALRPEVTNPAEVVAAALEDLRPLARRRNLMLDLEVCNTVKPCMADAERIRQIVSNLVSNAIKYTDTGGVRVSLAHDRRPSQPVLVVSVRDTGQGIAADKLADIWRPFVRLETGNNRRREGVGMGLAIVRGLVDLMNGEITVESEPGQGTTFDVVLPIDERLQPREGAAPLMAASPRLGPRRALVVDDKEMTRESFREMLTGLGIQCETAASADDAWTKLRTVPFDVLLLDVQMPGKDGTALVREVRASASPNQRAPVIWISAVPPETAGLPPEESGAAYLMKPVHTPQLRTTLERVLGITL